MREIRSHARRDTHARARHEWMLKQKNPSLKDYVRHQEAHTPVNQQSDATRADPSPNSLLSAAYKDPFQTLALETTATEQFLIDYCK